MALSLRQVLCLVLVQVRVSVETEVFCEEPDLIWSRLERELV